jgi:hypothetical protein
MRGTELQAVCRLFQQQCSALDQAHEGVIGNPTVGTSEVCPRQADLLQRNVQRMTCAPQIVRDMAGPAGLDHLNSHDDGEGQ